MKNKLVSVIIVTYNRKKDLIECIDSYYKSSYQPIEIIVLDNASDPAVKTYLLRKYPKVKIITSQQNLGAAEGRNRGLDSSKGDFVIFSDDDAYAEKDMVKNLVSVFEKNPQAGIVQPLVYDRENKQMLQGAGHDINLTTGRIWAAGVKVKDEGQYDGLREVPMCGCVWMVKREVFKKIGDYDEDYFIPYEDSDFSLRARKAGFKLYCYSEAKTYHRGHKSTFVHSWIEWLGITSPERAYRVARNKMIFMVKNSKFPNNLLFFGLFMPTYLILHSLIIILSGRLDLLIRYWRGVISGIWYGLRKLFNRLTAVILAFTNPRYHFKLFFMAISDPLPWVVDKSVRSILDLGCGQGKPMAMIKLLHKIDTAVGVELYKPYIKLAKKQKLHDKYIVGDVREINFKPKSYDLVLASHVIEHLPEKDAWKLLRKMEKIARMQVIVATPIGEIYQPMFDNNKLQEHRSYFSPKQFEKRGYKVIKYGLRWLLDEHSNGLIHKMTNPYLRKLIYFFNFAITPLYYLFPQICDYSFVALRSVKSED